MANLHAKLTDGRLEEYITAYSELLKPYVFSGRDVLNAPLTETQYDAIVSALVNEVHDNYESYKQSYEKPMPFYIGVPTIEGDKLTLMWETAYTFDVQPVTYTAEIATDLAFTSPIAKQEGLVLPWVEFDLLPAGQYFVRVTAQDAGGQSQTAFDYYVTESGKTYGTKCFYVGEDGQVLEDAYVED
jgi:spore coat protein H